MRKGFWLALAVFTGLFCFAVWTPRWQNPILAQSTPMASLSTPEIRVKTARPKTGKDLEVGVEQPANVASYYRVELQSPIAGTLKFIEKDIGDKVTAGERLAEIEPQAPEPDRKVKGLVIAPFDGVISSRTADPGTFVANPAIVPGVVPLLVVERTDIVTVSMKVPEAFVTQVSRDTEAELRLDAIPGRVFRFRLTRLAPSLDGVDRTLRVEVDLYNGTATEHTQFLEKVRLNQKADLKGRVLPEFPQGLGANSSARLLPGMYGKMRLRIKRFQNLPVVPSSAVVWRGGLPYLFRVESGVARLKRISLELDDGILAHVYWMTRDGGNTIRQELSLEDEFVITNQGELEDGTRVRATLVE